MNFKTDLRMKRFLFFPMLLSVLMLLSCSNDEDNEFEPILMCACYDGTDKIHSAEFMLFEDCEYIGIEDKGALTTLITKEGDKKPVLYYTYHNDDKGTFATFNDAKVGRYVLVCKPKYNLFMAKRIEFKKEPALQGYSCDVQSLLDKYEWETPKEAVVIDWVDYK